ncbi:hypothetical protein FQN54_007622 [Arachnomyces sp. PD_36]|nr:hypothetical protein FQN54_007622 [Arachnomyces sp. PD_36]
MSSSHNMPDAPGENDTENQDIDEYLDAADAEEEIIDDGDHPMESDDEGEQIHQEEMSFENDSAAHFDHHTDSLFCIAQHPVHPSIVITGSGDDTAYIFDSDPSQTRPVLPRSYESDPQASEGKKGKERDSLPALLKLDGHTDSVNAVAFMEPRGEYVVTAGLDGRLRVWKDSTKGGTGLRWGFVAEAQEVEEINWVAVCPVPSGQEQYGENENVLALGASDGSVWVYRIDSDDTASPISIINTYFQHTTPCTAGAWTPDGKLLATVSEEGSLYVFDVFGTAAAAGINPQAAGTQAVVAITPQDQRFAVEGGLYSVAVAPTGAFVAVGGAEGNIRVVGLPRLPAASSSQTPAKSKSKAKPQPAASGAGTIIASLQSQADSIETLSFSSPPLTLLAAGSVDGSIALFDTAHRFAVRRHIRSAHEDTAVVKVKFLRDSPTPIPTGQAGVGAGAVAAGAGERSWLLTSIGMDGVVRRWDTRGGTAAAGQGLLKEWRGHMPISEAAGEGEEEQEEEQHGGVLDFVQGGGGKRIVTAGDDGIALVFEE